MEVKRPTHSLSGQVIRYEKRGEVISFRSPELTHGNTRTVGSGVDSVVLSAAPSPHQMMFRCIIEHSDFQDFSHSGPSYADENILYDIKEGRKQQGSGFNEHAVVEIVLDEIGFLGVDYQGESVKYGGDPIYETYIHDED